MNKINSKNLYTDRLELRIPTMEEQHRLWELLINKDLTKQLEMANSKIEEAKKILG